jgi:hypothetical protein
MQPTMLLSWPIVGLFEHLARLARLLPRLRLRGTVDWVPRSPAATAFMELALAPDPSSHWTSLLVRRCRYRDRVPR